jgi:hypothetical protein
MNGYDSYPPVPASEVEWEELLVRYELGPRALRVALESLDGDAAAPEIVGDLLRALVLHEGQAAALLAAMRDGRPVSTEPRVVMLSADPQAIYQRYAELRGRNFAAVQRRGLEVWRWQADAPHAGPVTVHQLIAASTAFDGETLAGVRQALRGAAAC